MKSTKITVVPPFISKKWPKSGNKQVISEKKNAQPKLSCIGDVKCMKITVVRYYTCSKRVTIVFCASFEMTQSYGGIFDEYIL